MLSLSISPGGDRPLGEQIVTGIKRQIDERRLRPGTRLPSIRKFAETYGVSRFTVVEAYDRLVATGCLQSRRGSGFYALGPAEAAPWMRFNVAVSDDRRLHDWLARAAATPPW